MILNMLVCVMLIFVAMGETFILVSKVALISKGETPLGVFKNSQGRIPIDVYFKDEFPRKTPNGCADVRARNGRYKNYFIVKQKYQSCTYHNKY